MVIFHSFLYVYQAGYPFFKPWWTMTLPCPHELATPFVSNGSNQQAFDDFPSYKLETFIWCISHDFPTIFPWFSHDVPIFPWFSRDFPKAPWLVRMARSILARLSRLPWRSRRRDTEARCGDWQHVTVLIEILDTSSVWALYALLFHDISEFWDQWK